MKEERHVIWSNYGLDYEDWRDDLEAEYPDLSENERISLMYEINGDYLDDERAKNGRLFAALLVTDIIRLSSLLVISAPADFLQTLTLPQQEDNVYYMKDIVSRKKQLMPILSEILENYGRQP